MSLKWELVLMSILILSNIIHIAFLRHKVDRMDAELYRKEHRLEMLWKNFEWLLKDYEAYTHRPVSWWE